jgi:putative OPT family oligopeptide transporter
MSEKKGLSHSAYGGIKGEDYVPFISTKEALPELTIISIIIGCVLAALFAAANTYLALKVGMTIAAGIPAAVIGTGILKFIFKRNNILEANMISGVAAMGESLAAGIVFTLPAIVIWGMNLSFSTVVIVSLLGGMLGVLFIVPFRKYLTVEEHGKLAFPESMACAEVLVTSNQGGAGFKTVMLGLLVGSVYKLLSGGFLLWSEEANWDISLAQNGKPIYETAFGVDAMASLAGVGFIVGIEVSLYMFAGSVIAWFGLIPLIKYVGAGLAIPLWPSTVVIGEMSAGAIRSGYIKYIGAGAVAAGGFISLAKSMPTIINSFKSSMAGVGGKGGTRKRTDIDVPMTWVIGGAALVFFLSWLLPMIKVSAVGAILAIIFSFLFAVVSARMCGLMGASNNPVSGMTIATLLFITAILKATGMTGDGGMLAAILAGAIVCVGVAIAGGAGQALKTTYIIGGTPKKMELGMFAGVVVGAIAAAGAMLLMSNAYGFIGTGPKVLQAPQANLMAMVIQGVMTSQLPWAFVIVGVAFGVMCELMGLPVLAVALGIYLPIHLSAGILVGAIVRVFVDKKFNKDKEQQKVQVEKGILLASGLVAGDAIMGIFIAGFAAFKLDTTIGFGARYMTNITLNHWTTAIVYLLFAIWIYKFTIKVDKQLV